MFKELGVCPVVVIRCGPVMQYTVVIIAFVRYRIYSRISRKIYDKILT